MYFVVKCSLNQNKSVFFGYLWQVQCDSCYLWFHAECLEMNPAQIREPKLPTGASICHKQLSCSIIFNYLTHSSHSYSNSS